MEGLLRITRYRALCALIVLAVFSGIASAPRAQTAPESGAAAQAPAVVFAGRIAGDLESTRIFFDIDRSVDVSSFIMEEPARIVIDAPPMLFRFADPAAIEPRGLISAMRYGAMSRQRSRIVLTLAEPALITGVERRELAGEGTHRLVFDLARAAPSEFSAHAARQRELIGASGEVVKKGDRVRSGAKEDGRFAVVIDPGHGGIDGGAKGADGTLEKELTLAIALKLRTAVEELGPYDVKLTRTEDEFLSLRERVQFAERNHADLVISLHADSLRQQWVRGASVYTLSRKASDTLAQQLADSENMADIVAGLDNPEQEDAVTDILADLTARETAVYSRSFSAKLVEKLAQGIDLIKNPQRSASFVVLKAPEVPGVLLELGYLSNSEDEQLMTDPKWQAELVRLLARSVHSFFEPRIAAQ